MAHLRPLNFKLLFVGLPLFLLLWMVSNQSMVTALFLAVGLSVLTYFIGGLIVLPGGSVVFATLISALVVWATLWALAFFGVKIDSIAYPVIATILADGLLFNPYLKRVFNMNSMGPRI